MKNRSWLNVAESLMLFGSGVGSIATLASQQVLYTAAPVSALLVLNVLNHRRIEKASKHQTSAAIAELDQKLTGSLFSLQQQIQTLPSPIDLANLRKDLQNRNQEVFNELNQKVQQLQQELTRPGWRVLPEEINQLREQHLALANSVAEVRESMHRVDTLSQTISQEAELKAEIRQLRQEVAQLRLHPQTPVNDQKLHHYRVLQDQINHLNRRLNKLPAPFDASTLKQEVDSLIKVLSDMVSRRDLSRVEAHLERLNKQGNELEQIVAPLKIASGILKKQLETLASRLAIVETAAPWVSSSISLLDTGDLETLKTTVDSLAARLAQVPTTANLATLQNEFQTLITTHLAPLQQQLDTVQQQTQDLEQQQKSLQEWVHRLPQLLDSSALQNEVKYLATRVEWAENTMVDLQTQVETIKHPQANYELVFDVRTSGQQNSPPSRSTDAPRSLSTPHTLSSRVLISQSLESAQARLIIVFPFPDPTILDTGLFEQFQLFLKRQGCLDMGWGYLGEDHGLGHSPWEQRSLSRSINRRRTINPVDNPFLYSTLNQLTELKKRFPEQFRFKVLGTDEHFLVCDRTYAILGSPSMPTASLDFPTTAVGLRTTDSSIIQRLVERFDNPVLEPGDAVAYFNRASSRYDLGDRQGAITDYTQVLDTYPNDDVTYNNRGLARYDMGDKEGAIADFQAAIQHNPRNYIAYCNRGVVRAELGDKLAAIEDYTYAIQLQPDYSPAYFYRGVARIRMENRSGAIQDYNEVIRLQPDDATAYLYRGMACAKVGQTNRAIQDLQQAAHLFSEQGDSTNYQQSLNALQRLQPPDQ